MIFICKTWLHFMQIKLTPTHLILQCGYFLVLLLHSTVKELLEGSLLCLQLLPEAIITSLQPLLKGPTADTPLSTPSLTRSAVQACFSHLACSSAADLSPSRVLSLSSKLVLTLPISASRAAIASTRLSQLALSCLWTASRKEAHKHSS